MRRQVILLAFFGVLLMLAAAWLALIFLPKGPAGLAYEAVPYAELDGWSDDNLIGFDQSLARSCAAIKRMKPSRKMHKSGLGGTAADWQGHCAALDGLSGDALRRAIEKRFTPYAVTLSGSARGLFTGYYEPMLEGSFNQSAEYQVPLYARPDDLIEVNLGKFRADLAGRRIAGRIEGKRLEPYADRASIDAGALNGQTKPILWVKDAVAAFFLHIQGSGRVKLPSGDVIGVGYAGQNGHPYVAIGRILIKEGHAHPSEMSLQFIRDWLSKNPDEADRVMHANPSYIFFRKLENTGGPFGSAGVVLTPKRSLAVDRKHLPMHLPMFLVTSRPDAQNPNGALKPFSRLLMAQDTGGAITGEIRGDVFFGPGEDAEMIAGHMKSPGRYYILLPNGVTPPSAGGQL